MDKKLIAVAAMLISTNALAEVNVSALTTSGKVLTDAQMEALGKGQILRCIQMGLPILFVSNKEVGTIHQNMAYVAQKNNLSGAWTMLEYGQTADKSGPYYYENVELNFWGAGYFLSKDKGGEVHYYQDPQQIKGGYIYLSSDCK